VAAQERKWWGNRPGVVGPPVELHWHELDPGIQDTYRLTEPDSFGPDGNPLPPQRELGPFAATGAGVVGLLVGIASTLLGLWFLYYLLIGGW
jgi:hypothetical protein